MNKIPPTSIDGQPVKVFTLAASSALQGPLADSWPHGSTGNCICIEPQVTNGVAPNAVSVLPSAGGVGNNFSYAVVEDFDEPYTWQSGAIAHGVTPATVAVLFRNCDLRPKGPVFPPQHPPTKDTMTSAKVQVES